MSKEKLVWSAMALVGLFALISLILWSFAGIRLWAPIDTHGPDIFRGVVLAGLHILGVVALILAVTFYLEEYYR